MYKQLYAQTHQKDVCMMEGFFVSKLSNCSSARDICSVYAAMSVSMETFELLLARESSFPSNDVLPEG